MPLGLLGALLGGALMAGGSAAVSALNRPRIPRAAREGLGYQNLLLREYGLPVLLEHELPAVKRRSELETALWPLISAQLREALAPGAMSPETQAIYRATRRNWMQELTDAKERMAMDLAARGGIRSGAYPRRLADLERVAASGLAALYADLASRRSGMAMNTAMRMLGSELSPLTASQAGGLAGGLTAQAMRLRRLYRPRNSTLIAAITSTANRLLGPALLGL